MGPGIPPFVTCRGVGSGPLCSPSPGCFPFPTSRRLLSIHPWRPRCPGRRRTRARRLRAALVPPLRPTRSSCHVQLPRLLLSQLCAPRQGRAPFMAWLHAGVGEETLHLPATAAVRTAAALKTAPVASFRWPVAIQQKKRRVPRSLNRTESSKPKLCPICELVSG